MRKLLFVACTIAFTMDVTCQTRADITGTSGYTEAQVVEQSSGNFDSPSSTNLTGDTVSAAIPGFSSTHASVYSSTALSHFFNQTRLGGLDDYSYSFGYLDFTANANDHYLINGSFTNSAGYTEFEASLYDTTDNVYLFFNNQQDVGGGTFMLGNTGGNVFNNLQGSLSGFLTAGHEYEWRTTTYSWARFAPDGGAAASGSISVQFRSVPEPSSLALFGIAGIGIVLKRRRTKQTRI